MTADSISVEFTVSRRYTAEIDPKHFPLFPSLLGDDVDDDAETVGHFIDRDFNAQSALVEYYATNDNWDGADATVEVDDVVIDR